MRSTSIYLKTIGLFAALFFLIEANAQHKPDPEKAAGKQTEWMKTELSLSDEQTAKVETINLNYSKKKKELREQMRQQMKSLEQEKQKELSDVLTKEQLEKYETRKAEMKEKRKQHMHEKRKGQKKEFKK